MKTSCHDNGRSIKEKRQISRYLLIELFSYRAVHATGVNHLFREVFLWIKFWFLPTFDLFFVSFPFQNGTRRENGFYVKYVHLSVFFCTENHVSNYFYRKKKWLCQFCSEESIGSVGFMASRSFLWSYRRMENESP